MFSNEELLYVKELLQEDQSDLAMSIKGKVAETTKDSGKCLWSFYWDCGRSGDLEGLFIATKQEVQDAIGEEVYFGEVLGKHSEVYGVLEEGDVSLISDDCVVVNNAITSGWNPLAYLNHLCQYCGNSYHEDEMYCIEKGKKICGYCQSEKEES